MFQLTAQEAESLRSQFATSNRGRGGSRYLPYAFTEHGVVMLSSVLNSDRAVQVSILVVNAFIRMRELRAANKDLAARIEKLEHGHDRTISVIEVLVEDIDRLAQEVNQMKALPPKPKHRIGFSSPQEPPCTIDQQHSRLPPTDRRHAVELTASSADQTQRLWRKCC
jgi:hypothetical protein